MGLKAPGPFPLFLGTSQDQHEPNCAHSASSPTVKHLCIGSLDQDVGDQSHIQNRRNPALAQRCDNEILTLSISSSGRFHS